MDIRLEQNSNEKLARAITGPDTEASHFVVNGESADKILRREKVARFNQSVDDLQEKFQKYVDEIQEAGQVLAKDYGKIDIMPLTSYVLISPYKVNPFQKIVKEGGIITDLGGMTPTYKSQETGQYEEEQQYVKVGVVVETGTECKFLQPGDIVYYNIASELPVPFYKFGFVVVAEQRIIAAVNEGLTRRKEDIIGKRTE